MMDTGRSVFMSLSLVDETKITLSHIRFIEWFMRFCYFPVTTAITCITLRCTHPLRITANTVLRIRYAVYSSLAVVEQSSVSSTGAGNTTQL